MIQLTRLRQNTPFILNPDLIERVDTHVDTVVRLTNGTEYVVNETGEEIVRRTADFRARVIAMAGLLQAALPADSDGATSAYHSPAAAIAAAETHQIEALAVGDERPTTTDDDGALADAVDAVDAPTEPDVTAEAEPEPEEIAS
jgi:flagellar protein FlbD